MKKTRRGSARSQIAQNLYTHPGFTVSQRVVRDRYVVKNGKFICLCDSFDKGNQKWISRFLQARHDRTMRRNRELYCEFWIYHQICEARSARRRVFRTLCLRMVTRSCNRNLKPFYPQFLIVCHVAVVNENVCSLMCLLSNERAACFPADKRRFDKTNPYCIVALSKVKFLLICKLKTNFFAKSPELCMGCPLTRERKQKKIQFSPLKLSGTVESVCLRKCVNTKFYLEKRSGIEKSIGR